MPAGHAVVPGARVLPCQVAPGVGCLGGGRDGVLSARRQAQLQRRAGQASAASSSMHVRHLLGPSVAPAAAGMPPAASLIAPPLGTPGQAPTPSWTGCPPRCPTWHARCAGGRPSRQQVTQQSATPRASAPCRVRVQHMRQGLKCHLTVHCQVRTSLPACPALDCPFFCSICFEELDLGRKEFEGLSDDARAFIRALLVKDPLKASWRGRGRDAWGGVCVCGWGGLGGGGRPPGRCVSF